MYDKYREEEIYKPKTEYSRIFHLIKNLTLL